MGTKIHFGPPGPCFFGGRQATYEKELRELREKLAKRQAYLEEGEVPIFVGLKGHNILQKGRYPLSKISMEDRCLGQIHHLH